MSRASLTASCIYTAVDAPSAQTGCQLTSRLDGSAQLVTLWKEMKSRDRLSLTASCTYTAGDAPSAQTGCQLTSRLVQLDGSAQFAHIVEGDEVQGQALVDSQLHLHCW